MSRISFIKHVGVRDPDSSVENTSFLAVLGSNAQSAAISDLKVLGHFGFEPVKVSMLGQDDEVIAVYHHRNLFSLVEEAGGACLTSGEAGVYQGTRVALFPECPGILCAITALFELVIGPGGKPISLGTRT